MFFMSWFLVGFGGSPTKTTIHSPTRKASFRTQSQNKRNRQLLNLNSCRFRLRSPQDKTTAPNKATSVYRPSPITLLYGLTWTGLRSFQHNLSQLSSTPAFLWTLNDDSGTLAYEFHWCHAVKQSLLWGGPTFCSNLITHPSRDCSESQRKMNAMLPSLWWWLEALEAPHYVCFDLHHNPI